MKTQASLLSVLLITLIFVILAQTAPAGSATWNLNPTGNDWNTATNWTPATVPNGPTDSATFSLSNTTAISLSAATEVKAIIFSPGASAFSIMAGPNRQFTIGGGGVTNNSGVTQNFIIGDHSLLYFTNTSTAGSQTIFTDQGSTETSGQAFVVFRGTSTAGNATFVNEPGLANQGGGGYMQFADRSTAGHGTFVNEGASVAGAGPGYVEFGGVVTPGSNAGNASFTLNGGTAPGAYGGQVNFYCSTSAANATFHINGATAQGAYPGVMYLACDANADNATFIAEGGVGGAPGGALNFWYETVGGTARIALFGNSTFDISFHDAPGMTIGSLEGNGTVFLGANNLSVGSKNRDTLFSGAIGDGGQFGGTGGALTKIGPSTLTLAGASSYTGGTTLSRGQLIASNTSGSATGTGPVNVNGGTLGGAGTIAGAVTVGTAGGGSATSLAPGGQKARSIGTLTIQSTLTFNSQGTGSFQLDSNTTTADEVLAKGVTITSAASFVLDDKANTLLPVGTIFIVISNTATTPIAGTFSNLADGSAVTIGSNTFQANYEGGDGNDLTLTVVP